MKRICRTCLSSSNELSLLEMNEDLIDKIALLTTIQISQDSEDYPSTICQNCIENVNKYYYFRIKVIKADKELKENYETQIDNELDKQTLGKRKRKSFLKDCVSPKKRRIQKCGIDSKVTYDEIFNSSEKKESCDELPKRSTRKIFNNIEAELKNSERLFDIGTKSEAPSNGVEPIKSLDYDITQLDLSDEDSPLKKKSDPITDKENGNNHSTSTCEECNLTFSTRAELINHKRSLHTAPGICNICGAVVRADNLSKHVQTHNEEPVDCKICGKPLKNSQSLRTHLLIHRGTTYTCDICGRTSKVKSEHSRHMKTHVDPNARKTMCTICGKRVRHLKHHLLTHTGEKPHVCRHCNKGFTRTYSLKVHSRQHTNEKPFICECCSMGFNQKISLLSHLKSKHGAGSE